MPTQPTLPFSDSPGAPPSLPASDLTITGATPEPSGEPAPTGHLDPATMAPRHLADTVDAAAPAVLAAPDTRGLADADAGARSHPAP
ncbi:hypothetical protein, partial [Cognatiluteimonas telluris]|uniref:hypothetical protein n=1 Tax=Cognatiluteimonas telluris TaxID=1104775 RepID=UPI001A9C9B7E